MCTIGYVASSGLVFKNRDKSEPVEQEIVRTDGLVALRTVDEDYCAGGINKHGCGFVTAAVRRQLWDKNWLLSKNTDLVSPSGFMSDTLADCTSIDLWLEHFQAGKNWQGFNLILFESGRVVHVLLAGEQVQVTLCLAEEIHTNHFASIEYQRTQAPGTGSCDTFARLSWAKTDLPAHTNLPTLQKALNTIPTDTDGGLWLTNPTSGLVTVSSIIFDTKGRKVHYCFEPGKWQTK